MMKKESKAIKKCIFIIVGFLLFFLILSAFLLSTLFFFGSDNGEHMSPYDSHGTLAEEYFELDYDPKSTAENVESYLDVYNDLLISKFETVGLFQVKVCGLSSGFEDVEASYSAQIQQEGLFQKTYRGYVTLSLTGDRDLMVFAQMDTRSWDETLPLSVTSGSRIYYKITNDLIEEYLRRVAQKPSSSNNAENYIIFEPNGVEVYYDGKLIESFPPPSMG